MRRRRNDREEMQYLYRTVLSLGRQLETMMIEQGYLEPDQRRVITRSVEAEQQRPPCHASNHTSANDN